MSFKCPFCDTVLTDDMQAARICFGCGKNFEEIDAVEEEARKKREKERRREEEKRKQEAEQRQLEQFFVEQMKLSSFMTTTGYNFEGYRIKRYLGVVHGECVLGTGFYSELSASISDFLGTTSTTVANKLSLAKENTQHQMTQKAINSGANALIGIDFDVSTIYNNMLLVSSNATAVIIEKINDNK